MSFCEEGDFSLGKNLIKENKKRKTARVLQVGLGPGLASLQLDLQTKPVSLITNNGFYRCKRSYT